MVDLHSHILPGLDDGVTTIDEAREVARASFADGIRTMAATPHVRADYPTTPDAMERGVDAVARDLAGVGVDLEVVPGGEVDIEWLETLSRDDVGRFTLAQTGRYLLLEFPYYGWPPSLEAAIHGLRRDGITAILAHPERNSEVQERPEWLEAVVSAGALVQVTAGSIEGVAGRAARRTAIRLLDLGLVDVIASDAHAPTLRQSGLRRAAEVLQDRALAQYLTEEAPSQILAGEPVSRAASRGTRGGTVRRVTKWIRRAPTNA